MTRTSGEEGRPQRNARPGASTGRTMGQPGNGQGTSPGADGEKRSEIEHERRRSDHGEGTGARGRGTPMKHHTHAWDPGEPVA